MDHALLIDAIVRHSARLVADLAVLSPASASLEHVTDLFFTALDERLREDHGRPQPVIADLFGLALRTYQHRVKARSEATRNRGATVWEAVYRFVHARDQVSRTEIDTQFSPESAKLVGSILTEMVRSRLLFCAGRGLTAVYMTNPRVSFDSDASPSNDARLAWVVACRRPDATASELASDIGIESSVIHRERLQRALVRLEGEGRLVSRVDATGTRRYACADFVLEGTQQSEALAAVLDHYSVVVEALCAKFGPGAPTRDRLPATGATYRFDLHAGTRETAAVEALADELRERCTALRVALDDHGRSSERLVFYFGQSMERRPAATPPEDEE